MMDTGRPRGRPRKVIDPTVAVMERAREAADALPALPSAAPVEIRHPRLPPRETTHDLIRDRINAQAQILDNAMAELQFMGVQAKAMGDMVAAAAIQDRLARLSSAIVLSPVAASIRPGSSDIDLSQFSDETRQKLMDAFAAASAEMKAKESPKDV